MSRVLDELVTSSGSDDDYINTSEEEQERVRSDEEGIHNNGRQLFVGSDEEEVGADENDGSDDEDGVERNGEGKSPWQFQGVIRKEINDRLPSQYNLKRWRKPSRVMLDSIMQLLESNGVDAIDAVFDKYERELHKHLRGPTHLRQQEIAEIKHEKEQMVRDILLRIEKKLRFSKFPARLSENDFNVEYIYEKRRFLQERYAQELHRAEMLEKEITKENKLLQDARLLTENLQGANDRRLRDKLEHHDIHPSMLPAISADLDSKNGENVAFLRDMIELNLDQPDLSTSAQGIYNIEEQVPSFNALNEAIRTAHEMTATLLDQTHINALNRLIL